MYDEGEEFLEKNHAGEEYMIKIEEYLNNPCAALSIPYWNAKNIVLPDTMKIVHESVFSEKLLEDYEDEKYFRLYHSLDGIERVELPGYTPVTAEPEDMNRIVSVINASYTDIQVSHEPMLGYTKIPVYQPELWILVKKTGTGECVGCGIADYDKETGELIQEWIQVLPEYRKQQIGTAIVNELLYRGKDFVAMMCGTF